jgi:hypothetical protein
MCDAHHQSSSAAIRAISHDRARLPEQTTQIGMRGLGQAPATNVVQTLQAPHAHEALRRMQL